MLKNRVWPESTFMVLTKRKVVSGDKIDSMTCMMQPAGLSNKFHYSFPVLHRLFCL